jgi:hypothetical protein
MNPRGILVATNGDDKVYYFIDDIANSEMDGAIISPDGSVQLIDFGAYILTEPFLREYRHTDFHRFLWGRNTGEELDRWMRIFVYKTQPVDSELLKDVKIETTISPKIKSKHYFDNRAMEFKSLNSSNQMELMSGVSANRKMHKQVRAAGRGTNNASSVDWRSSWASNGENTNG